MDYIFGKRNRKTSSLDGHFQVIATIVFMQCLEWFIVYISSIKYLANFNFN